MVEITPMIDVVFLLIVFFMTAAQFAREQRAPMALPREAGEVDQDESAGLVINLMDDQRIVVQDETVAGERLDEIVLAHLEAGRRGGGAAVTIRADRRGSTSALNALVRRLEELGVTGVQVGTERP
jgi:biopolymer transport protein ExbD